MKGPNTGANQSSSRLVPCRRRSSCSSSASCPSLIAGLRFADGGRPTCAQALRNRQMCARCRAAASTSVELARNFDVPEDTYFDFADIGL
jgi:hypothetical protein